MAVGVTTMYDLASNTLYYDANTYPTMRKEMTATEALWNWENWQRSQYPLITYKEEDTMELFDVYLVYGGNRANPIVMEAFGVPAADVESAKIKSGLMQHINPKWSAEYVTFIVRPLGKFKVRPKVQRVKLAK